MAKRKIKSKAKSSAPKRNSRRISRKSRARRAPTGDQLQSAIGSQGERNRVLTTLIGAVRSNPDDVDARLTLAEYCLRNGYQAKILEAIEPLEEQYPLHSDTLTERYDRLRCLGLLQLQNLQEAEATARRGIEQHGDHLDFYWCLTFVHLSLLEQQNAIEAGNTYLRLIRQADEAQETPDAYCVTAGHVSQLYNFLGSALMESGRSDEAAEAFDLSREYDPGNHYPYLNLINLYRHQGDTVSAKAVLEDGLSQVRQAQELRMLGQTLKDAARVSACMIVKNEEEMLPGCLDSIRDVVDEIIVVDTGSTDRTVQIAESYGAKVYHQAWEGDFSKHRNFSLEQATGDWVFVIDADERLASNSASVLKTAVNDPEARILQVNVLNHYPQSHHRFTLLKSVRLWRRELNLQYSGMVHNQVIVPEDVPLTSTALRLDHLGYALSEKRMQAKFERTHALLRKQVEQEPENGFAWFNLAQVLRPRLLDDTERIAPQMREATSKAIELTSPDNQRQRNTHLMALDQMAWTEFYTGNYDEAEAWAQKALKIMPDYLDPLLLAGHIRSKQQRYDDAIVAYRKYLEVQRRFAANPEAHTPMLYHPDSRTTALFGMGLAAEMKGDSELAKKYYSEAIEISPDYLDVSAHLGRLYLAESKTEDAEKLFRAQLSGDHPSPVAAIGLGDICSSRRDYQQAVNYYRRAVKLMPGDFSARVKLIGALYRCGRQHEFIAELKEALESRPRDEQAYVQVVRMLIDCGDMDGARNIHSQGLQNAKTTDSLELMADQLNQDSSISVCMIVKNEEEMLPECLDSVRDWADEIVVVDTGSEDRTIEIAESYGARIFHQPWEGDFSKHRNYSIEQATRDWIFIIDADERFEPEGVEMLRRTMNNPNINVISINVFNVYGDNHDVKTFLPSVRAWRRELGLKYEGIVHNALALGEHPVYRLPVNLQHLGYDLSEEKMRQKHERTKTLLEKQLEEDPDNVFALFNYSQVLRTYNGRFAIENIPTILETSERAVRLSDPTNKRQRHLHLMCLEQIAASYFHQKEYEKAIEYCDRALELKPDYLDPLMIRANCLYRLGEAEKASEAYRRYLEAQAAYDPGRETDPIILGHVDGRAPAQYSLASIAYDSGDLEAARYHFEEALRVRDGFKDAYARIGQIYYDDGEFDQARRHFLKQLETGKKTINTLLGLALIYKQTGMNENAEEYFREALELEAFNSEVKAKYGRFLLEQDRVEEARDMIEEAIKHDKDKLNSLRWAGQLYTEFEQHELSADCFSRILETFGDDPDSLNDQANCYYQQKEFEKAAELYQRAVELASVKPVTWRNMGLALFQLNRCEEAISSLETYLEQCPHDLDVVHVAGDLYSKTGQFDKALGKYEIYLSKNPVDTLAMFNLSECYLNMGHIDSAVMGYKRVLQIDPEFRPASDRLSQVLEPADQT